MRFDAIVHAPELRIGARLNIAAADQPERGVLYPLSVGAEVRLRLGVCCPDHASGVVADHPAPDSDSAVLAVNGHAWIIRKSSGGVTDRGLLSETWFVTAQTENR